MANLSPEAQAVKDAFDSKWAGTRHQALIAAIYALAYNVYSDEYETCGGCSYSLMIDVDDIVAIAKELETL
jgi:hypothetical protein